MRTHDHETEDTALRPKASRIDPHPPAHLLQAAAAGRSDVLDGPGILGLQRAVGNAGVGALLESEPAQEQRSPVHDVVGGGAEARSRRTFATRCRAGSVTISRTCGCTPTRPRTTRRSR